MEGVETAIPSVNLILRPPKLILYDYRLFLQPAEHVVSLPTPFFSPDNHPNIRTYAICSSLAP